MKSARGSSWSSLPAGSMRHPRGHAVFSTVRDRFSCPEASAYRVAMSPARLAFPLLATLLAGSTSLAAQTVQPVAQPAAEAPCSEGVLAGTRCLARRDSLCAYFWLAMPPTWNRTLVVHANGGPELGQPKQGRASDDLTRWSIWTRTGSGYAGTGYYVAGVSVHSAAADLETVRRLFVTAFSAPKLTIVHGQSWAPA